MNRDRYAFARVACTTARQKKNDYPAREPASRQVRIRGALHSALVKKINTNAVDEFTWASPKGTFAGAGKQISEALGRKRDSTDLIERHPFDVEIARIPAGCTPCPYHSHSMQWEFYHVISGGGVVRHEGGKTAIGTGDAFIFKPGEAHQLINDTSDDLVLYVVADNPIGESCHYPDSNKWAVKSPSYQIVRSEPLDYYDGEE
ncbi:MAG: cupin domain-containing protein [Candidatus Eremiobacteraeota bacterium]|nr:cupin domain-containing protein [Candidatus Eremiobacteraeota bacterium]